MIIKPLRFLGPLLALTLTGLGCGGEKNPDPPPAAEATPKELRTDSIPKPIPVKAKAVMDARWGAKKLEKTVHGSVLKSVELDGAATSLGVCADSKVASEIGKLKGIEVGRASLKLRNPDNIGPQWVQEFLADEPEDQTEVDLKSISNIVEVEGGEVVRFLRRIKMEEGCLACHGETASMDPAVVAAIQAKYPEDKAVGYTAGSMRGVVWAEAPVAKEPAPIGVAPQ